MVDIAICVRIKIRLKAELHFRKPRNSQFSRNFLLFVESDAGESPQRPSQRLFARLLRQIIKTDPAIGDYFGPFLAKNFKE